VNLTAGDEGRVDLECRRRRGRYRGNARTDDVAPRLCVPSELEQLAVGEVGVQRHSPLLVQDAVDVAEHAVARRAHATLVLTLDRIAERRSPLA
jgi:hypothetical protein